MLRKYDLLIVLALCLLQVTAVLSGYMGPARVALGFLFLAFLPGYSFLAAAYRPGHQDFNTLDHVALAVPVSLALDTAIGLLANTVGQGSQPNSQVTTIGLPTVVLALIALVRSRGVLSRRLDLRAMCVLGTVVLASIGIAAVAQNAATARGATHELVSLSILDAHGQTARYRSKAMVGESLRFELTVMHRGPTTRDFALTSSLERRPVQLHLAPQQTWSRMITLTPRKPGLEKVSWNLSSPDDPSLIRSVHLWISVR